MKYANGEHLLFYIRILQQKKILRTVIKECYWLFGKASDDKISADDLLASCAELQTNIYFGKTLDILPIHTAEFDWYVNAETGRDTR